MEAELESILIDMGNEINENISAVNSGGCGFVAYYVAKHFKFENIVCLESTYPAADWLNEFYNHQPISATHMMVEVEHDLYYDSDGLQELDDLDDFYRGDCVKIVKEPEIENLIKNNLVSNDMADLLVLVSPDNKAIVKGLQKASLWNCAFDRDQLPKLENIIIKYAKKWERLKK
ncbi:MAG: hypothetical protein KGY70_11530 [Bacteroidales bacterium]|nr:hypothetical protein [Bacteroidales bacterium]